MSNKTNYGSSIIVSEEKMYQQGTHFNKHGRKMGYKSKKEYEKAARRFIEKYRKTASIYEGVWTYQIGIGSNLRQSEYLNHR